MDLATAQAEVKAAKGDVSKVSADALAFFAEYTPPATDGLLPQDKANAMVASARKKAEAQIAELQEQLAAAQEAAESKAGKPDYEKQLERMQAKMAQSQKDAEAAMKNLESMKRSVAIKDLSAQVGWHEGVSADVRDAVLDRLTRDMSIEDLADASALKPLIAKFRETNPTLIAASTAAGAGSAPGAKAGGSGGVQEISMKALNELTRTDPAKAAEIRKQAWAGVQSGKVKLVA